MFSCPVREDALATVLGARREHTATLRKAVLWIQEVELAAQGLRLGGPDAAPILGNLVRGEKLKPEDRSSVCRRLRTRVSGQLSRGRVFVRRLSAVLDGLAASSALELGVRSVLGMWGFGFLGCFSVHQGDVSAGTDSSVLDAVARGFRVDGNKVVVPANETKSSTCEHDRAEELELPEDESLSVAALKASILSLWDAEEEFLRLARYKTHFLWTSSATSTESVFLSRRGLQQSVLRAVLRALGREMRRWNDELRAELDLDRWSSVEEQFPSSSQRGSEVGRGAGESLGTARRTPAPAARPTQELHLLESALARARIGDASGGISMLRSLVERLEVFARQDERAKAANDPPSPAASEESGQDSAETSGCSTRVTLTTPTREFASEGSSSSPPPGRGERDTSAGEARSASSPEEYSTIAEEVRWHRTRRENSKLILPELLGVLERRALSVVVPAGEGEDAAVDATERSPDAERCGGRSEEVTRRAEARAEFAAAHRTPLLGELAGTLRQRSCLREEEDFMCE